MWCAWPTAGEGEGVSGDDGFMTPRRVRRAGAGEMGRMKGELWKF